MRRESGTDTKAKRAICAGTWAAMCLAVGLNLAPAQQPGSEDQAIDQIRQLAAIGPNDQVRIRDWVETQVGKFTDFEAFRKRFRDQFVHVNNSPLFPTALAAQAAAIFAVEAINPAAAPELARSMAQVLHDMNASETYPGLIALLKADDAPARYLAASGLSKKTQTRAIAADPARLLQTINALRDAGSAESDPVVLGRIYEALGYSAQASDVFDAYMKVFDARLGVRRQAGPVSDGAERFAYAFFTKPAVLGALKANQKQELVKRLAVFLRLDGDRYDDPNLGFAEIDRLERTLWAAEEILTSSGMVGNTGGKIIGALQNGGHANPAAVQTEIYKWIGDSRTGAKGPLNSAPWNIPVGAP